MNITETIARELTEMKEFPKFKAGDNVTVHYTIKEGTNKELSYLKVMLFRKRRKSEIEHLLYVRYLIQ